METNVNSIVKGTIMFVNREARTATVNVNHMVPAVLSQNMMIGSDAEKQNAFRRLQQDSEIEVIIVSIPSETDANGMIVVRQYDAQTEARNAALAKLVDGTIVSGQVIEVNGGGAIITVDGVKIFIPASELNGRQGKLRSIRPGEQLTAQISGRKQDQRRGLSIFASQRLASETARKQKRQDSIVILQQASANHIAFKRVVKSVTEHGAFIHMMNGIDGLLGSAQMDKATQRLFDQHKLVQGAEITVEIEHMRQNDQQWRLRLNQKLVPVRKVHAQINSESTAREVVVYNLKGQPGDPRKRSAIGGLGQAMVEALPQKQEVIVRIDGVFGVLNNSEISAADWKANYYRLGAKVKVYSAAIDTHRGQLQLKAVQS